MITEKETNAMVIAKQFILNQNDISLIKDFSSLLLKIKSVLRYTEKENITRMNYLLHKKRAFLPPELQVIFLQSRDSLYKLG